MNPLHLFNRSASGLLCPKCERPLEGHDQRACERHLSRRFFLGALGGVITASLVPSVFAVEKPASGMQIVQATQKIFEPHEWELCTIVGSTHADVIKFDMAKYRAMRSRQYRYNKARRTLVSSVSA